ncbi:hypothetical protein GX563_06610 [Candidatus Bathyarchaeota archaeon]|nr:hypothetical protein [Candidatus Bathyarchaeota archaeon]
MNFKKTSVFTLILLLSLSNVVYLFSATQAQTSWVDITLPYTINQAGNYRITAPWISSTPDAQGLIINASDVTVDGQNYPINVTYSPTGIPAAVYVDSQTNIVLNNLNITGSYYGLRVENSTTVTVENCTIARTYDVGMGIQFNASSGFTISGCTLTDVGSGMFLNSSSYFNIVSTDIHHTTYDNAISATECENFTLSNVNIVNSSFNGLAVYLSNNYMLKDSSINGSTMQAVWSGSGKNVTVTNCLFKANQGNVFYTNELTDAHLNGNTIINNTQAARADLSNVTFSDNFVSANGLTDSSYYGGFQSSDSNCTVTGNTFEGNYDAIMWGTYEADSNNTYIIQNNNFQNNQYTFFFDYRPTTTSENTKLVFNNNLVNDTCYVDPVGLNEYTNSSITPKILNLNSTVQFGDRPYGNGPYISGNYWAYPNGTGPSQTGIDADKDGFIDAPFELFDNATAGTAYDYHPYSDQFDVNQWVNITLPAEIYSPGRYRIMSSFVSDVPALGIYANNVTVDGGNFTIAGKNMAFSPAVYAQGVSNLTIENLTVQKSLGVLISGQNVILRNVNTNNTLLGIYLQESVNVRVSDSRMEYAALGLTIYYSENVTVSNCVIQNSSGGGIAGVYALYSNNFVLEDTVCSGTPDGSGLYLIECNSFQIKDCSFNNNSRDGVTIRQCANFTLQDSTANHNQWGSELFLCSNATIKNCQMSNNSQAIYSQLLNNVTFTGNTFSYNGLTSDAGTYHGGLEVAESNCTVTNNIFESNYDAYIWKATNRSHTGNQLVYGNIFRNNKYTFFFLNNQPNNVTLQKLVFYNNFVNDSATIDPVCFNSTYSANYLSFNSTVFAFNTTLQTGTRIYGNGPQIGGNFWANPSGTGLSQTGVDANHDGFIDTLFDVFNNASIGIAYDYLPLSTEYAAPTPTPTPSTSPTTTPTPTPSPTSTPAPTSTPTSTPTPTQDTTNTTTETPWLLIVAVIAVIAVVAVAVFAVSKRKSNLGS